MWQKIRRFIRVFLLLQFAIGIIVFSLSAASTLFRTCATDYAATTTAEEITDVQLMQILNSDTLLTPDTVFNQRCWYHNRLGKSCMSYHLDLGGVISSARFRDNGLAGSIIFKGAAESRLVWQSIYGELYRFRTDKVYHIADSLRDLAARKNLSRNDFARLVVSFVQSMPYWFVVNASTCADVDTERHPCIAGVPFGLLTPEETAAMSRGDCDSRALLLYTILRYLTFRPLILISDEYAHAMLALDVVGSGDNILYNGKQYYFWETTAEGWEAGMLPPNVSNRHYWKIALTYEF